MAQSWERSRDGLVYTFHLRPDIKWSNGEPLHAYDFLNSWERALNPKTASEYSYQLYYLVNGEAYGTGKLKDFSQVGVKAPDDHTLIVTLSHPTAYFLELTSFQTLCPVLPALHREVTATIGSSPAKWSATAPYLLKEWRLDDLHSPRGESLLLEAGARAPHQGPPHEQRHSLLQSLLLRQGRPAHRQKRHPQRAHFRYPGGQALFPRQSVWRDLLRSLQRKTETLRRRPRAPGLRPRPQQAGYRRQDHPRR